MKKSIFSLSLLLCLVLTACGGPAASSPEPEGEETLHILATTYPVYLFTTAVTAGVEGVEVTQLVNQQTACLHDYTLTVNDMKAIEKADVIVMNGAGLEDFMADALAQSDAAVIDCSAGIKLLPTPEHAGHDGHDHEEEYDPHIWMSPANAELMLGNLASGLSVDDPDHAQQYADNRAAAVEQMWAGINPDGDYIPAPQVLRLITFHDGFQYFASYFIFNLEKSIEEEEGAETSAAEIKEIVGLIEEYHIPAIFTERNGSDATAQAIARETGCKVYQLDMIMSGNGSGIQPYIDAMTANIQTIVEAFQ